MVLVHQNYSSFFKKILHLLLFFIAFLPAVSVQAQNNEIISQNFVLSGDISVENGTKLITELEAYRTAMLHIANIPYRTEAEKIPILVLKDQQEFSDVTGNEWASGVYVRAINGYMFVMLSGENLEVTQAAKHIAVHEYTHHFFSTYAPEGKAQWYHEGLAEYYSSFEILPNGEFKMGKALAMHQYVLNQSGWLTMIDMINSLVEYPKMDPFNRGLGASQIDFFYAQSWLMVHYLQNHPNMQTRFEEFLSTVNSLENTVALFEQTIGMTPLEFEDVLRDYLKQNEFRTKSYTLPPSSGGVNVEVRALSESSRAVKLLSAMSIFGNLRDNEEKTETLFAIAEVDANTEVDILLLKVMIDLELYNNDAALLKLSEVKKLDYNNAKALFFIGLAKLNKSMEIPIESYADEVKYKTAIKTARGFIMKSMTMDANLMGPKCMYAISSTLAGKKPDELAVTSAEICAKFLHGRQFARQNLSLVPTLIHGEKYLLARNIIKYGLEMDDKYIRETARDYSFELEAAQE